MYAASAKLFWDAYKQGGTGENWTDLVIAFVVATIVAFVAVKWLLRYIQTHRFTVFAVYRIVLGALLLLFLQG
jgi:undecaprenyl-diphosphatase